MQLLSLAHPRFPEAVRNYWSNLLEVNTSGISGCERESREMLLHLLLAEGSNPKLTAVLHEVNHWKKGGHPHMISCYVWV